VFGAFRSFSVRARKSRQAEINTTKSNLWVAFLCGAGLFLHIFRATAHIYIKTHLGVHMKKYIGKIKRGFARETLCVNGTLVLVFAIVCASLGLIFALGGVDYEVYGEICQPNFYFPPFVMVAVQVVFYALFGASMGVAVSTPYCRKGYEKFAGIALSVCTLFLCFTWIPLVYTAASFFIAFVLCLIILVFCAVIFKFYIEINSVAAFAVLVFALFDFYLVCYSMSLFILN
jgi:tryptophan-rich sensory protein